MNRRVFLRSAAALPFAGFALRADPPASPTLITRSHAPQNLEMNFAGLGDAVTPTTSFYVRNHFAQPKIDLKTWRLKVEGAVERPLELSPDDLHKISSNRTPLTMECAGN